MWTDPPDLIKRPFSGHQGLWRRVKKTIINGFCPKIFVASQDPTVAVIDAGGNRLLEKLLYGVAFASCSAQIARPFGGVSAWGTGGGGAGIG
jgi:hypothetical protein